MVPSLNIIKSATLVSQGAEAKVYKAQLEDNSAPVLIKHRFRKRYRHPSLDASLTRSRIAGEARALLRCLRAGVNVPGVRMVDASEGVLGIEWIEGQSVRRLLPGGETEEEDAHEELDREDDKRARPADLMHYSLGVDQLMELIGLEIAKMHQVDVIHGDLTTSNMILQFTRPARLVLIDFGLSYHSTLVEDKAVDLYVLERAFSSTHPDSDGLFTSVLDAYAVQMGKEWRAIVNRLEDGMPILSPEHDGSLLDWRSTAERSKAQHGRIAGKVVGLSFIYDRSPTVRVDQ